MNKLADEKSPYLKQHANNPVEWYPWNEQTLALAKKLDKPIFLSIGYSTCHWCHVMAHESFENEKIAEIMNQGFLNIKIDREERPDVDAIYMTAVQALTGSGGWPMSIWLTPELKPFFAGTYFPPDDRNGRPGFPTVLTQLSEAWEKDRARVLESANQISDLLTQYTNQTSTQANHNLKIDGLYESAFLSIKSNFDPTHGGFGPAPKFPMPVYLDFLLAYYKRTNNKEALNITSTTLKHMSLGGIYDQLGGGFARYSTDEKWIVPHFEKMLYDNAQLISVMASLFEITKEPFWKDILFDTVTYLMRDLRHAEGGFYSAEDADSEGKEGTFYLWTKHEITQHLSPEEAAVFISTYGVTTQGNFFDPHTREEGQNILIKVQPDESSPLLESSRKKLIKIRNLRPRPHRDEKILTEWNGLMISALVKSGLAIKEIRLIEAAEETARFFHKNLYDPKSKRLFRRWVAGERKIEALQADYAMLIQGILDLYESRKEDFWLQWAVELQRQHDQLFFDEEMGGYFMNVARPDLLIRMKDDRDNVIPSGNSVAVRNGLRLTQLTGENQFRKNAEKTVHAFSAKLTRNPVSMTSMIVAMS